MQGVAKVVVRYGVRSAATVLLALTLVTPTPAWAEAYSHDGPPTARDIRYVCAGFGQFAYKRARERDRGWSQSHVLEHVMRWGRDHDVDRITRQYHQEIVATIYAFPSLSALDHQRLVEHHCHVTGMAASGFRWAPHPKN